MMSTSSISSFHDTSTECAICLGPLYTTTGSRSHSSCNDDDRTSSSTTITGNATVVASSTYDVDNDVITLSCGHKWHYLCLKEQIEHTRPNYVDRLLFRGCRCPKCNIYCDHPLLDDILRPIHDLRNDVDQLILQQLQIDWIDVKNKYGDSLQHISDIKQVSSADTERILDVGRTIYAFYLCSSCQKPYFGGTMECGDELNQDGGGGGNVAVERVCSACSPLLPEDSNENQDNKCTSPALHRPYHIWKCRYCCHPATFLCYGNVHFCQSCHDRNTKLDQQQRHHYSHHGQRPTLKPIACTGGNNCPYPKPNGSNDNNNTNNSNGSNGYHNNGSSSSCEQVYYCMMCSTKSHDHDDDEVLGSYNLLKNPCGNLVAIQYWEPFSGYLRGQFHSYGHGTWFVEHIDLDAQDVNALPIIYARHQSIPNSAIRQEPRPQQQRIITCFVSSYYWCQMKQTVYLRDYVGATPPNRINPDAALPPLRIEISAKYIGRTDCPSLFALGGQIGILSNGGIASSTLLEEKFTNVLNAPVDSWEQSQLLFDVDTSHDIHNIYITIMIFGKDARFWAGNYGSKVTDCCVRILGTPNELQRYSLRGYMTEV